MNPLPVVRAMLRRNPFTAGLFVLVIALAVALGIAISAQERALRQGSARAADRFDLLVAAPGSQTDLLLSAVYLRPSAVELLPGPLAHRVLSDPDAAFAAPIAFGDSYRDSQVVGTSAAFVTHLGGGLAQGRAFAAMDEAVVGALVDVPMGAALSIRHGHADDVSGGMDADHFDADDHQGPAQAHEDPTHEDPNGHGDVTVVGRMNPTGTPWDRAVVVPVEYIWFAHGMGTGHTPGDAHIGPPWDSARMPGLPAIVVKPDSVAAAYGLRARYRDAGSTAFFPAETLVQLYGLMGHAARVMAALTLAAQVLVVAAILAGILAVLDLQRKSFAVLRALGAPAAYVFLTVWLYVAALLLGGAALGLPLGWAGSALASALIAEQTGVAMQATLGGAEIAMAAILLGCGFVLALVPAWRVYRQSVVDGLQ